MKVTSAVACLAVAVLAGCSESTDDGSAAFVGQYHAEASEAYAATEFTLTVDGTTEDLLASGGIVDLTLASGGTTTGRIFAPGGGEEGEDFDESLAGTWTQEGDIIYLDHEADTFLRDIPLHLDGDLLSGEYTDGTSSVRVAFLKE